MIDVKIQVEMDELGDDYTSLSLLVEKLDALKRGQNVLLNFGKSLSLIKYEAYKFELLDSISHSINRHVTIVCIGNLIFNDKKAKKPVSEKIREKTQVNIYASHCLDFEFDEEFAEFFPLSCRQDVFLLLVKKYFDDSIDIINNIEIISDELEIRQKLKKILRTQYYTNVIKPFLHGKSTIYQIPRWKRHVLPFNLTNMLWRYQKTASKLKHGDFVYIGSKEEVYLLGTTIDGSGNPYMQGTYITSTKPILYFSNNYLNDMSRFDAEMPLYKGRGVCNVAKYRTREVPGFNSKPFIFPQIGRSQNCKNTVFTGEPDIITGDLQAALAHFATTDFCEFRDLVERYANSMDFVHPSFKRNGKYFY